ncbi:MAG TPA: nuclear transport factor 2 family protein [Opitutus sp.]|nr:nuclear transport factor 2 family protein [Opitutus sp.]
MTLTLPPLLAAMIAAHNAHDSTAFAACFTDDAIVRDEGRRHYGKAAVKAWFEDVSGKYGAVAEVTDLTLVDGEPVLSVRVSGDFEGSPIELRYFTALEDGKIVALKIAP